MGKASSVVADLTPLALGAGALFLLARTDLFKKVGGGVGEAVSGVGSGLGTIGREAGDIIVDAGSFLEPIASFFQGTSNTLNTVFEEQNKKLRRESFQEDVRDINAESIASEPRSIAQADREIFSEQQKTERSKLLQSEFTQQVSRLTKVDDFLIDTFNQAKSKLRGAGSSVSGLISNVGGIIGGFSAEFSSRIANDTSRALTTTPESGGSIVLPASTKTSSVRSTGNSSSGGGSSISTNKGTFSSFSEAVKAGATQSVAPKTSSVRSTNNGSSVISTIKSSTSSAVSKAKSLLSSITKKLRK